MNHQTTILMFAFALCMSGCINMDEPVPPGTTDNPPTVSSTEADRPDGTASVTLEGYPMELRFDDCSDSLHAQIFVVNHVFEVPTLPGWEESVTPDGELHYRARTCERVSVGPFERGPVNLFYETHNNRRVPGPCAEGEYANTGVLQTIWLDDAEIADYLRTVYLMPAQFASISLTKVDAGMTIDFLWTVELPGSESSELVYRHIPDNDYGQREYPSFRYFWASAPDAVSYMDTKTETHTVGEEEPTVVEGTLKPPLLYTNLGMERFVAYGGGGIDGYVHGEIHLFKDTQCSDPL